MEKIDGMGMRLKLLRTQHGLTQEQAAKKLNMSTRSYAKTEKESRYCGIDELVRMSDLFGVSVQHILFGIEEAENSELTELMELIPEEKRNCVTEGICLIIKGLLG